MADYLCGLDLGKTSDPSAFVVVRRTPLVHPETKHPLRSRIGRPLYRFRCGYAMRWPLGTSYPQIVKDVCKLVIDPRWPKSRLFVDATGVGKAVVDMFLDHPTPVPLMPITITAGSGAHCVPWPPAGIRSWNVAKTELVSSMQAVLQPRLLKFQIGPEEAAIFRRELVNFQIKVTTKANETFSAREGTHDDLVLALAIVIWAGGQPWCTYRPDLIGPFGFEPETARMDTVDATDEDADTFIRELVENAEQQAEREKREAQAEWNRRQAEWLHPDNEALWGR